MSTTVVATYSMETEPKQRCSYHISLWFINYLYQHRVKDTMLKVSIDQDKHVW